MAAIDEHCNASDSERLSRELGDPRTAGFGDAQSRAVLNGATNVDAGNRPCAALVNQVERVPWIDADGNILR